MINELPQGWEPITTAPTGAFITVVDNIDYATTPFSRYSAISDGTTWKDVHGAEKAPGYWLNADKDGVKLVTSVWRNTQRFNNSKPLVNLQFYPGDIVEILPNDERIDEEDNFCLYLRVRGAEVDMSFCPDYYFDDIPLTINFNGFTIQNPPRLFWSSFHNMLAVDCHEWEQIKLIKAQIRKIERP
jgi:hypothetical protein